jgi:GT2 family glycosyltransferase
MSFSVIIPSRSIDNLRPCVAAVCQSEFIVYEGGRPHFEYSSKLDFVIVDDGLAYRDDFPNTRWVSGAKPFVFSRNVNMGIAEAIKDPACAGIVALNDDALLKTPGGFSRLAELAAQHEDIGIIAPVTNVTGQPLQMPKGVGLRQVPHIAFVAVYIPRRTIDRIGMLDERYAIDYGVEDRDYCEAVNRAGLKVCVYDHVFVDHGSLRSTFRGDPKTPRPFTENFKLFKAKWGMA